MAETETEETNELRHRLNYLNLRLRNVKNYPLIGSCEIFYRVGENVWSNGSTGRDHVGRTPGVA
jgi:hypothetical protein